MNFNRNGSIINEMKALRKNFDNSHLSDAVRIIAGVDEAGRGPLAGPVVAAAVIFDNDTFHEGINDSKQIPEKKREVLYDWIIHNCIDYGIGIVGHDEIDDINILQATLKAMKTAASKLKPKPNLILIDGNKSFYSGIPIKTIVKGDTKSFAIAAASIIAKVTRDRLMREASANYPQYMWDHNKGYGTRAHVEALKKFGPSPLHRKTFLGKIFAAPEEQLIIIK